MTNLQDMPPNAGAVLSTPFLNALVRQLPSSQEKRGDYKLDQARELTNEFQSVLAENDLRIIEDKITLAREMKEGLDFKSGISKFVHAREYRRASRDAFRYAKHASDRGERETQFHHQSGTSSGSENIYGRVIRTARSLHRCFLSCKDAFPPPDMKGELAKVVWNEACAWEGADPDLIRQDDEFVCSSMMLLTDIKTGTKHAVQSLYEFSTSRAPDSIGHNASRAQALLTNMTFVYRDLNFDGSPHYPYRHPIIQKVIDITWFQNNDGDGIVFDGYFAPIPIEAIALTLTVIECCIDEWSDGTFKESNWSEERYKTIYLSHINSLHDFRSSGHQQGGDPLAELQYDLLKGARMHAGVPPDPLTGSGRLATLGALDALQVDLPEYIPTRVSCE